MSLRNKILKLTGLSRCIKFFKKNDKGVTAIEYALLGALIGIAIIVGAGELASSINTKFTSIGTAITNAT